MFSNHEKAVIKILGRKEMTIANIAQVFYKDELRPLNGENYIAGVVRRIKNKCEYNELPWTIMGIGSGRAGRTVWKVNI